MWAVVVATLCAGLFAGAAIYVNVVEHPARLSCGTDLALREFRPSYRRATVMQASLAIAGCVIGLWSAWVASDLWLASAAILLGLVVPFTLVVMLPTNHQLVDPALDPRSPKANSAAGSLGPPSCRANCLERSEERRVGQERESVGSAL